MMHEKENGQKLRNWKFSSFDRLSIDQIPIKPGRFKQKNFIAISIGRETNSIDQKFGKKRFFKKQSNFMHKLLKP